MPLLVLKKSNGLISLSFGVLWGDNGLFFLFDTGAICPVVGVNSFFVKNDNPDYSSNTDALAKILRDEIKAQKILPRPKPLKTANN